MCTIRHSPDHCPKNSRFVSEYNKYLLPGASSGERKIEKHNYIVNDEATILLRNSVRVKKSGVLYGRGWVVKDRRRKIVTFNQMIRETIFGGENESYCKDYKDSQFSSGDVKILELIFTINATTQRYPGKEPSIKELLPTHLLMAMSVKDHLDQRLMHGGAAHCRWYQP